jgi:hypothetical protein
MHRIDRVARIHHDNRRGLSVSAAGVVPVTAGVLRGFVLPGRQDQGRRPALLLTGLQGMGWPCLTRGQARNLAVFAQVKAKRDDLTAATTFPG